MIAFLKELLTRPATRRTYDDNTDSVQQERNKLRSYYRDTFSSVPGNAVLEHLCKVGHMGSTSYVAGDPHQTSFNEGMRYLVTCILNQIKPEPEQPHGSNTAEQ